MRADKVLENICIFILSLVGVDNCEAPMAHKLNLPNVSTNCRGQTFGRQKTFRWTNTLYNQHRTKTYFMTRIKIIGTIVILLSVLSPYFSFFFFSVTIEPLLLAILLRTICVAMNVSLIVGILTFTKTKLSDRTLLLINRVALTILIIGYIFGFILIYGFANDKP